MLVSFDHLLQIIISDETHVRSTQLGSLRPMPCRLTAKPARQLLAPSIELAGADTMLANNLARTDARLKAPRDDFALLLD
jgi:hypothetical protein